MLLKQHTTVCKKAKKIPIFFFISFLWSRLVDRYGAGTGTEIITFQKPEPEPKLFKSRNQNRKK
jgi:hypothetical protein